jgi:hypothetical protein
MKRANCFLSARLVMSMMGTDNSAEGSASKASSAGRKVAVV